MIEPFEKVKERLEAVSERAADKIISKCIPMESELSESKARLLYGDKWIRRKKASGEAHPRRHGTRTLFGRAELDRLRAKEREPARLIFKTPKS